MKRKITGGDIVVAIAGFSALGVFWYFTGWQAAASLFVLLWMDNIARSGN